MPDKPGKLPRVIDSKELARLIGISPDSVNYMARKGAITGYKAGYQWCFKRNDVEAFSNHIRSDKQT